MKGKIVYSEDGKQSYYINGKEVTRKRFFNKKRLKEILKSGRMHTQSTAWPRISEAITVAPEGAREAEIASQKLGVPTRFVVKDDDAAHGVFESKKHYKEYMKAFNLFD